MKVYVAVSQFNRSCELKRFKVCIVYSRVRLFWIYITINFFKTLSPSFHVCVKIFNIKKRKEKKRKGVVSCVYVGFKKQAAIDKDFCLNVVKYLFLSNQILWAGYLGSRNRDGLRVNFRFNQLKCNTFLLYKHLKRVVLKVTLFQCLLFR